MMTGPTTPIFDFTSPPPPASRGSAAVTMIAWVVILLCVGLLASHVFRPSPERLQAAVKEWDPAKISNMQLQLLGQAAVASKSPAIAPAISPSTTVPTSPETQTVKNASRPDLDQLLRQMDQVAKTPLDEFRTIPVVGEVAGRQAALDRLREFETRHTVVRLRNDVDDLRTIYTKGSQALSPEQARALVHRHGWFGKLALAWRQPENSPERKAVLEPARRLYLVLLLTFVAALGAVVIGLILLVIGIVLVANGAWPLRYRRTDPLVPSGVFAEGFAVFIALFTLFSFALAWFMPDKGFWPTFALALLVPVAFLWMRRRGLEWGQIRDGIGWRRGRGFFSELGLGAVGYLAGLPIMAVGILITVFLMQILNKVGQVGHPIQNAPMQTPWDLIQLFLLASVWAPIVEETVFRGMLFAHLRSRLGWTLSALINGVLFAAIHPQGWIAIPSLTAIAVVLSGLREWRGSILAPMAAHGLNNAIAITLMWTLMR